MFSNLRDAWVQENLPLNTPDEVARIIAQCAADESIHGKAVYVAGGMCDFVHSCLFRRSTFTSLEGEFIKFNLEYPVMVTLGLML